MSYGVRIRVSRSKNADWDPQKYDLVAVYVRKCMVKTQIMAESLVLYETTSNKQAWAANQKAPTFLSWKCAYSAGSCKTMKPSRSLKDYNILVFSVHESAMLWVAEELERGLHPYLAAFLSRKVRRSHLLLYLSNAYEQYTIKTVRFSRTHTAWGTESSGLLLGFSALYDLDS